MSRAAKAEARRRLQTMLQTRGRTKGITSGHEFRSGMPKNLCSEAIKRNRARRVARPTVLAAERVLSAVGSRQ